MTTDIREQTPRDRAVEQLKKRRDFRGHILAYVLVNAFFVAVWVMTGPHGFFWPVFLIGLWGIGVVMNAWDVYWRRDITEEDIQHEIERDSRQD
jgi:hypothetical protein